MMGEKKALEKLSSFSQLPVTTLVIGKNFPGSLRNHGKLTTAIIS